TKLKSTQQTLSINPKSDIPIAADAKATLRAIIQTVKKLITPDRKSAFQARGAKLAAAHDAANEQSRKEAAYSWDSSPISTARLSAELGAQIKNGDWSLASGVAGGWPTGLWDFDKYYQHICGDR